jgi:hypothetical protein
MILDDNYTMTASVFVMIERKAIDCHSFYLPSQRGSFQASELAQTDEEEICVSWVGADECPMTIISEHAEKRRSKSCRSTKR